MDTSIGTAEIGKTYTYATTETVKPTGLLRAFKSPKVVQGSKTGKVLSKTVYPTGYSATDLGTQVKFDNGDVFFAEQGSDEHDRPMFKLVQGGRRKTRRNRRRTTRKRRV